MELRRSVAVIWRRIWLIILATALVAGGTYGLSINSTPIYQAVSTIEINYGADPRSDAYASLLYGERAAKTYVEQLRSPQLAREVASALGISLSPGVILGMSRVDQVRDTQLIRVYVEHSSPELAQAVANKIAEVFIAQTAAKQEARYQSAKRDLDVQIADLEKQIADTQKAISALGDPRDPRNANIPEFARVEQTRFETTLSSYQTRYVILLRSAEDFRLAAARNSDNINLFSPAEMPRAPIRPQTTVNVMLGVIAGLALGLSLAFLLEYLDDTVKGPEEIETAQKLTTLGVITRIRHIKQRNRGLVTAADGKSTIAEAYRVLRTNFQFAGLASPHSSVVVTSAWPSEGKTTTLANLGVVLAQAGKRVILVDSDLRRPTVHKLFEIPREPGLTDLLLNPEASLDQVLVPTHVEGLRVLPSGPLPPNPAEILSSPRMEKLMRALEAEADIVLFDSPPVLSVADSALLAAATGHVVLVVAAGATRTNALARAKEALTRTNARILGVVLNKVDIERGGYYYYYYHRYYNYYGRDKSDGKGSGARPKRGANGRGEPVKLPASARISQSEDL
ncbi:MAG: polysaccharide biosynthesis tyrosine autokinase [Chloroflexi bacterium]|nr:polysaccharide biosynthesis tyrosine autokinase [Chloroflexota bacterium]